MWARTFPLGILLACTAPGGIRAKVVPKCVERSSKLRYFAPGPWEDMQMDLWLQRWKVDLVWED